MRPFFTKAGVLLYCVLLFSFGAGKSSVEFKGDENFYFESSRHMLETGDALTPKYMDEERFQKPILFYWFILFAFKAFGVSWLAARIPSIILGSLCALLVFRLAELLFKDRKAAVISSLFFATTPLCYRYARLAVPDMALVFFEALALYFFIRHYKDRLRVYVLAFFAALAAAFMIKGPIGAVIPLLVAAIFWALKKEISFKFSDILAGIILFALITVPWFYMMCKAYPGKYMSQVFGREIVQRLSWGGGSSFILSYLKGFFYYISALITKFFPYSLIVPFAFAGSYSAGQREKDSRLFLTVWALTVFLFFTLVPERRTHYLLALAPAVSILAALFFFRKPEAGVKAPVSIIALFSVVYIAITVFTPFGLFSNRMEKAATAIHADMKDGDKVGIGSHGIIPEELQVFFKKPVADVKATYTAEGLPSEDTGLRLRKFLNSPEKVFCVIKKNDYEVFIPEEMRNRLYVIGKYFIWKRRIRFDSELKELLSKGLFREVFQNEIYVVSNKR